VLSAAATLFQLDRDRQSAFYGTGSVTQFFQPDFWKFCCWDCNNGMFNPVWVCPEGHSGPEFTQVQLCYHPDCRSVERHHYWNPLKTKVAFFCENHQPPCAFTPACVDLAVLPPCADPAVFNHCTAKCFFSDGSFYDYKLPMPFSSFDVLRTTAESTTVWELFRLDLNVAEWRRYMVRDFRYAGMLPPETASFQTMWNWLKSKDAASTLATHFSMEFCPALSEVKIAELEKTLDTFLNFSKPEGDLAGFFRLLSRRKDRSDILVPPTHMFISLHHFDAEPKYSMGYSPAKGFDYLCCCVRFDLPCSVEELQKAVHASVQGEHLLFWLSGDDKPFHHVRKVEFDPKTPLSQELWLTDPDLWWRALAGRLVQRRSLTFEALVQLKFPIRDDLDDLERITQPISCCRNEFDMFPGFSDRDPRLFCRSPVAEQPIIALLFQNKLAPDLSTALVVTKSNIPGLVDVVSYMSYCETFGDHAIPADQRETHWPEALVKIAFPGTTINEPTEDKNPAPAPVEETYPKPSDAPVATSLHELVATVAESTIPIQVDSCVKPAPATQVSVIDHGRLAAETLESALGNKIQDSNPKEVSPPPPPVVASSPGRRRINITPRYSGKLGTYLMYQSGDAGQEVFVEAPLRYDKEGGIHNDDLGELCRHLGAGLTKGNNRDQLLARHADDCVNDTMIADTIRDGFYRRKPGNTFYDMVDFGKEPPEDPLNEYFVDKAELQEFLRKVNADAAKFKEATPEQNVLLGALRYSMVLTKNGKLKVQTWQFENEKSKAVTFALLSTATCDGLMKRGVPSLTDPLGKNLFWSLLHRFKTVEAVRAQFDGGKMPESWHLDEKAESEPQSESRDEPAQEPVKKRQRSDHQVVEVDGTPSSAVATPSIGDLKTWQDRAVSAEIEQASNILVAAVDHMWGGFLYKNPLFLDWSHLDPNQRPITRLSKEVHAAIWRKMKFTALVRYELSQGGPAHFVAIEVSLSEGGLSPSIWVHDSLRPEGRKSVKWEGKDYGVWSLEHQIAHLVQRVCGEGKHVGASIGWHSCPGQTDGISCLWFALTMCRNLLDKSFPVQTGNGHSVALSLRRQLLEFLEKEIRKHPDQSGAVPAPAQDEPTPSGDAQCLVNEFAAHLANGPSCPGSPGFYFDNSGVTYGNDIETINFILHGSKHGRDEDCDKDRDKEQAKRSKTGDDDDDGNGLDLN
jgi:hypothetical protein